jgi:indolepyruvate ferredoxin oxidoreductase, beta subunit
LKASEVAGIAAMRAGFSVKKTDVHGMAQRGGSVESHLIFGKKVFSPLIIPGEADFIISFCKEESIRMKRFLKKEGIDFYPYIDDIKKNPYASFSNFYLLGILSVFLPISNEYWIAALQSISLRSDENATLFSRGIERGKQIGSTTNPFAYVRYSEDSRIEAVSV